MTLPVGARDGWSNLPRHFVPVLATLLLLIVQLLPWSQGAEALTPSLVLMSVYFWSLGAPRYCPPLLALVAGLLADLCELTPLGAQAIIFLGLSLYLRRMARSGPFTFLALWVGFAGVVLAANAALWLIECVNAGHLIPLAQVLTHSAVALIVFPLVTYAVLRPAERLMRQAANG